MSTSKKIIIISLTIFSFAWMSWASFFKAEFMSAAEAEKKWGIEPLDTTKFRKGPPSIRSSMVADILRKKSFVGTPMKSVRQALGDPDSYFFSDTIYAYQIMPFPGEKKENWHLIFVPDEKLSLVKEVKIHKKCCYPSPLE